jgi:hypothetical protein
MRWRVKNNEKFCRMPGNPYLWHHLQVNILENQGVHTRVYE